MGDLIPEGCIPLTEVLDRYQTWLWNGAQPQTELLREARWDLLPPQAAAAHRTATINITDLVLAELTEAFAIGELEALVRPLEATGNFSIPVTAWREAFFPERLFLAGTVARAHGGHLDGMVGRSPFMRTADFQAFLDRKTASTGSGSRRSVPRSVAALSDVVLHLVMDGVLSPAEAEALAAKCAMPPFSKEPDHAKFDPMTQAAWSLPMTIAWIVWRTTGDVRRAWNDFRSECWEWISQRRNLPTDGGTGWIQVSGHELRVLEPISLNKLGILEALNADFYETSKLVSIKTAREDLWRRLAEGELVATGLDTRGIPVLIPEHEWPYLGPAGRMSGSLDRDYLMWTTGFKNRAYTGLTFKRREVLASWPAHTVLESSPTVSLQSEMFRAGGKLEATRLAIASAFPDGLPLGLSVKDRLKAINEKLELKGISPVSPTTVRRALKSH
jgi:hypothetical protein